MFGKQVAKMAGAGQWSLLASSVLLSGLPPIAAAQENNQPPAGFRALFNGQDLTGWYGMKDFNPYEFRQLSATEQRARRDNGTADARQHWSAQNGDLVNDGHGAYLTTGDEFENIDFWIDYKTVPLADSGIYLRATPQIQIWDFTEQGGKWDLGADKGSGGLWNNATGSPGKDPTILADRPLGEWNRFHIRQLGARTSVWLNDHLVVDNAPLRNYWQADQPLIRRGPIQLQTHGGEIRWRNVFLRELPWDEVLAELRTRDAVGFDPIFNGRDLSGWEGPVENYQVSDGVLGCKPGEGGTIYTREEYDDFVVRFEFKLPPGGNNGLAIRYPGDGDTAYVGMCELQILDNDDPRYAQLDPRQYHGSAYGMAPAARGYLRPTGEWNFQEVTVRGSTIRVELNGYEILNTDLANVKDFMANSPHPGKDRLSGHFGFAGHGDPVEFRNVSIKRLK